MSAREPEARSTEARGDEERGDEARGSEARPSTADLVREADDVGREDGAARGDGGREPLFSGNEAEQLRTRWSEVQAGFVDEPRRAVEDADALVAELMQRLAETFASERAELERQWDTDGDVSTEDLRIGLQRYRSFFDRLLSA